MEYQTLYAQMGGAPTIRRLVEAFYPKVQGDPEIGPLFPADITPVMEKQYLFLSQFLGGPALYNEVHGHPMLRQRHMPFPIDERRARAWLRCMSAALDEIGLAGDLREQVFQRLSFTAAHMINRS
ncbi:MAG TPA: globin [Symbiobacteriaceae bacterium]|nr:globin [Symbiobacteriaceae bacterium]